MENKKATDDKISQLINWFTSMGEKGYYKKGTISTRITAIKSVTQILDEKEKSDLSFLLDNVDEIVNRWATKTNAAPGSIRPTKSHIKSLIEDYFEYLKNPANFRPKKRGIKPAEKKTIKGKEKNIKKVEDIVPEKPFGQDKEFLPSIHIDIQIHIASDAPDSQIEKIFESIAKHLKK